MKKIIKNILKSAGFEINKVYTDRIGSDKRPVGRIDTFLQDIKKRGLECRTILDVGANNTIWSRMAKSIYPDTVFYLIEPQHEMKEKLEKFCNEFNDSKYVLAGAGAKNDVMVLTMWDDLAGSSFVPKADAELIKSKKQREVQVITIDALIESSTIQIPELIKLDIQGFELEALKGASKTFGNTEVYILEVSLFSFSDEQGAPIFSDIVNFMLEKDYVVYDFPGFLRRPIDGALGQCDICFVKRNGFLRKLNVWE